MTDKTLPAPWKIVAKTTPFHPWMCVEPRVHRLSDAVREAERLKAQHRYYLVHVRAR